MDADVVLMRIRSIASVVGLTFIVTDLALPFLPTVAAPIPEKYCLFMFCRRQE